MTAKERHREAVVYAAGPRPQCALMGMRWGRCSGRLQADHVLEVRKLTDLWNTANGRSQGGAFSDPPWKARLRAVTLDELIADGRNGWLLCADGHHAPKTLHLLRPPLPRHVLPHSVELFARSLELGWLMDRTFGRRTLA